MPQVGVLIAQFAYAIGPTAFNFIVRAIVAVAITAASRAIFKPKAPAASITDNTVTVRDPLATRKIIYGQARVGGVIVFIDTTESNKYLHLVIAFAAHEVESFDTIYFDENELTLSGNDVTAPANVAGKAKVYTHLGTDAQTADANLVAESVKWSSNHRLRGIAYAYVRLQYDQQAFPSGIPNITALISGKKVYDPRTATTVYSNNAALCAADYLMDSRYGLATPLQNVDMSVLTTAADTAYENVTLLAGGTEKRYTCNGLLDTAKTPRTIIEELSAAKGAATVSMMGQWYVHCGEYRTPVLSFDEGDMAGTLQVQTRHPRSDLFNQVKGTYHSPVNDWQPMDYPPVTSSTYVTEDNGEVIYREIDLQFTTSAATAQRLGLLSLNRARRQLTVSARFKMHALDAIPTDVIQLSNDRMGWTNKTFEVLDWRFSVDDDLRLGIELTLVETDSAVYTWSTADESAANASPTTNLPDFSTVAAPTGLGVSTFQVPTSAGDETYKALLTWTAPTDEFVLNGGQIEIQYKVSTDSTYLPSFFVNGSLTSAEIILLEKDETYDVQIRSYNGLAFSSWVTVFGFTVLGSGGTTTNLDYDLFSAAVTTNLDYDLFSAAVTASNDYGSFV